MADFLYQVTLIRAALLIKQLYYKGLKYINCYFFASVERYCRRNGLSHVCNQTIKEILKAVLSTLSFRGKVLLFLFLSLMQFLAYNLTSVLLFFSRFR